MAVNNNLYPPIVDSYMPAFLINSGDVVKDTCRVYFSLSAFNNLKDIKNAQVTVRNQNTNLSMLNEVSYPCEIMLTTIREDTERKTDDKYFIEIKKTDMLNNNFEINQYYKVQIRFTGTNASDIDLNLPQQIDAWLAANLSLFSEWSTVCLIRGISSPTLTLNNFNDSESITYLGDTNVDILGNLTFADADETETLKSYRIKLLDGNKNTLIDSDIQYANNYNSINSFSYTLNYNLIEGNSYILSVEYTTQNLYHELKEFKFVAIQTYSDKLNADLKYVMDEANAAIGINIKEREGVKPTSGNITIRRTSSESNFTIWEDVHTFAVEDQELDYTWFDYTIESGIWYKYCAQKRSSSGQRGVIVELHEPRMLTFEDMFLTGYNQQLKIEFNPTVSSFKRNVVESNTVTIGNKYPFIKRNGSVYYRSFPISGLISSEMDEDNIFTTREDVLNGEENVKLYDEYNKENRIPYNYDFTYEREFREKVEAFLMENKVRLFRSPTEGNILVKLTDVNFQPNQTLGRRLFAFSATAYEIDEYNVANCDKYGIQSLGAYQVHVSYPDSYFGQLQTTIPANKDVLQILKEKYQQRAETGYEINIDNLDYLKLEMESQPYLISDSGDGPTVAESGIMAVSASDPTTYNGYLVYVNDIPIVISSKGIYELTNDGVKVTSLYFPVNTKVNMDYNANVTQQHVNPSEEETGDTRTLDFTTVVGQLMGGFSYKDPIVQKLWSKYYQIYSDYSQSLYYLNDVGIEAAPNTVVYIKEDKDSDYEKHVIGPTSLLAFENEEANIVGIYFFGTHFKEADDVQNDRDSISDLYYKDTGIILDDKILMRDYRLVKNGVYTLTQDFIEKYPEKISAVKLSQPNNNISQKTILNTIDNEFKQIIENKLLNSANKYIWYNERFWPFTEDGDLLCPVEATINYTCDVIKERYV